MHITTSTHVLSLGEDHVYSLRKIGVAGDDSWLESRRGEAFDRRLRVVLHETTIELFFENKSIGHIQLTQKQQVNQVVDLVHHWNHHIGPTDLQTTKTTELIREWPQLLHRQKFSVKCVTYNCAGLLSDMALKRETWATLLGCEEETEKTDIIVLSFQESDSLNRVKNNYMTLQRVCDLSRAYLFKTHKLVSTVQLLGLMTIVFVKQKLVPYVSHISTDTSSTGFLRVWGNKGAVKTKFYLFRDEIIGNGIEFVIVNCHLSAGEGITQLGRRKWELREIGSKFGIPGLAPKGSEGEEGDADSISSISDEDTDQPAMLDGNNGTLAGISETSSKESVTTGSSDGKLETESTSDLASEFLYDEGETSLRRADKYVVLMGDLNYRVLLSASESQRKISSREWEGLLSHDSLSLERRQGLVFRGFEEAKIDFPPTYKYDIGTSQMRGRIPSYTDRIMYRTSCVTAVQDYSSETNFNYSDHRPVILRGSVESNLCVDMEKRDAVVHKALMISDTAENNSRPKLDIAKQTINLVGPPLSIGREVLHVQNKGSRPVPWVLENASIEAERVKRDSVPDMQTLIHGGEGDPASAGGSAATTSSGATPSSGASPLSSPVTSPRRDSGAGAGYTGSGNGTTGSSESSAGSCVETAKRIMALPPLHLRPDTLSLTPLGDVIVTPGEGQVSATRPTADIALEARIGICPRDVILLLRPKICGENGMDDASVQKYVFVRIEPTPSNLGAPLRTMELMDGIPVPILKCVEYLRPKKRNVKNMFLVQAEPSLFQQVLHWIDSNQEFDLEVLEAANAASPHSGEYAVAQVLLALFWFLPDQLVGPNAKRKLATREWKGVTDYICSFLHEVIDTASINELESLDVWAEALYDHTDKKAGPNEKRAYLRSMLIIAEHK